MESASQSIIDIGWVDRIHGGECFEGPDRYVVVESLFRGECSRGLRIASHRLDALHPIDPLRDGFPFIPRRIDLDQT